MELPKPTFALTAYGDVDATVLDNLRREFDTTLLLQTVERLAPLARYFRNVGGLRDDLLRLHRMTHTVINGAPLSEPATEDVWEVAAALIDDFRLIAGECQDIAAQLQPLADLQPLVKMQK